MLARGCGASDTESRILSAEMSTAKGQILMVACAGNHAGTGERFKRLGLRLRTQRLSVLFKGGFFMRFYQLSRNSYIPRILETYTR